MKYKDVSREEFEEWARRNPGMRAMVNGKEIITPVPQAQDLGFFGNLLRGVTKPFRTVAAMPEYLFQSLQAAGKGKEGMDPGEFSSVFLTPEEEIRWARDPIKEGLKSSVGLGAYLVPGGGGGAKTALGRVGTAAGRGAISGSMSGLAYSGDDEELESMLKSGVLGGLLGGAFQGVGELGDVLAKRKATAQGISDQEVKNWIGEGQLDKVGGSKRAKEGISIIKGEANELGIPTLDRLQRESAIDPVVSSLDNKADLALAGHDPVSKAQITKEITDRVKNIKGYKDNAAFVEVKNILKGYDKTLTGPEVRALYKEIADAGSVYGISPTARASTQRIWKAAREGVRGTLTGEGSKVIKQISSVYSVKDSVLKQAGRDVGVSAAGGLGVQFKPRIATKIADRASGMASNLPQVPTEGIAGILQQAPRLQGAIPAVSSLFGSTQPGEVEETSFSEPAQGYGLDKMALVEAVLNGQLSITEANWLMEMLAPQTEGSQMPTTESGRKFWFATESANNILRMLDETGPLAGPLQGIRTGLTSAIGVADEHTALKNEIESMRSIVFNALGGAQLTPNEQKQYEKFIPKVTDTKAQVRQKLQTLIPKLQGLMGVSSQEDLAINQILGL